MDFAAFAFIVIGLFFVAKFALIGTLIWFGLRLLGKLFGPRDNSVKININITQPPQPEILQQIQPNVQRYKAPYVTWYDSDQVIDPSRPELVLPKREPPLLKSPRLEPPTLEHAPYYEHPRLSR